MDNTEKVKSIVSCRHKSLFAQLESNKDKLPGELFYQACEQIAKESFLAYLHACMRERFQCQPFHRVIAQLFEYIAKPNSDVLRVILSAPPRAGKSMLTQYLVAWCCGLNENTAHIFFSYGQRLSTLFMAKVYAILNSPEHQRCFPNFSGFVDNSKTLLKGGGLLFGTSVGGAITGISAGSLELTKKVHPGFLVADDPLKNGESDAEIEALEPFWVDEANTRRTGNWRQLVIATRFAESDLHGVVIGIDGLWSQNNPEGWLYCNLPALCRDVHSDILDRKYGEAIWEGHPTLSAAPLIKLENSPKHYSRFQTVYQGNPTPPDGNIVKESELNLHPCTLTPATVILAIDSASGASPGCDHTAITIASWVNNTPIILDQIAGNWDIIQTKSIIAELITKYKPIAIGIEAASTGLVLIPELKAKNISNSIEVVGLKPSLSKVARLQSVQDLIFLCRFSPEFLTGEFDLFKSQLLAFPRGKKDDRVDSFVWSLILLKNNPQFHHVESVEEKDWDVIII